MPDTTTSRRRLLLAGLLGPAVATLPACGGGEAAPEPAPPPPRFTADGLPGRIVSRLRPSPIGLLAATDAGAYRRGAQGWTSLNLDPFVVYDITAVDARILLASVGDPSRGPGPQDLVESIDGGLHWRAVGHDFGGDEGPEGLHALVNDAAAHRLLATGADVLAESIDLGRSWRRLAGEWHAFAHGKTALAVDPARGDVWYGGQDAIEGFALFRRREAGGPLDGHPGLLPSPSVVKGITFAAGEPQRVLVSGEGGIVQTRDDGGRWQTLLANGHRFHFDVLQDPRRPARWVTASWEKNFDHPQPLQVDVSDDDGQSWRRIEHPDRTLFGGVWSLAAATEGGRSVFYLGLYKGGVMRLDLDG